MRGGTTMANVIMPDSEQIAALKQELANIETLKQSIALAERAGINVAEEKARLLETEQRIRALLAVYDNQRSTQRSS